MGLFIIALIIIILIQIKQRESIPAFIVGIFGMFTITLILTGVLNICLTSAPQTSYLVTDTKTPLCSFEYSVFLVNAGDYINYLTDTETGLEMKSEPVNNITIHFTEGEPCMYLQCYKYKNPFLNFMILNITVKKAFYIPENSLLANYYMNLEGG